MRKSRTLIAPALLLAGALVLLGSEVIEEIVAIVNDDVITLSQYKEAYETAYQMIKSQLQPDHQHTASPGGKRKASERQRRSQKLHRPAQKRK